MKVGVSQSSCGSTCFMEGGRTAAVRVEGFECGFGLYIDLLWAVDGQIRNIRIKNFESECTPASPPTALHITHPSRN